MIEMHEWASLTNKKYITLLKLFHKERSICFAMNKIEVNLSEEKINFINNTYQKELKCWKEAALKKAAYKNEANELKDLASLSYFLIRKAAKDGKKMDINGIISYLKSQYSADNRDQITFIQNYPSQRDVKN